MLKLAYITGFKKGLEKLEDCRIRDIFVDYKMLKKGQKTPEIFISPALSSPITIGFFKPVIVIPHKLYQVISNSELQSIVWHELSHILHKDHLSGLFQRLVMAMYWWNPLVYLLSSEFSKSREFISDNHAIGKSSPKGYARCLLTVAEKTNMLNSMPGIVGMATSHIPLKERIRNIIEEERKMETKLKSTSVILIFLSALFFLSLVSGYKFIFALHPVHKAEFILRERADDTLKLLKDELKPRVIRMVKPKYPQEAARQKLEDDVQLEATTDIYGRVKAAKILKGKHQTLNEAALKAVKQWIYEPYLINGIPKAVAFDVTVKFRLNKQKE
jgi:TonB family protein